MLKIEESTPFQSHNVLRCVRLTAGQKVSKKYRKQLWKRECRNLKAIVPSVANKNVSEVEVIEEAVDYIEQLHRAIADRLGMLPCNQMIAALHHMAKLKTAAQADARTCEQSVVTPTCYNTNQSSAFTSQQSMTSFPVTQRHMTSHASTNQNAFQKTVTPLRL